MAREEKTLVLVADDEPSTLALVSSHLRAKGYRILEASDGDHAWELAHEHLPDVVVLDVMMPGMSGWEVCRKIREAVSLAHTGVVMLTGIGETLNEMTSPLYGADAYVDKPFEFSDLDRKIKETVSRRRAGAIGRPDHADVETVTTGSLSDPEPGTKPGVGGALPKPASAIERLPPVEAPKPPPPPRRTRLGAKSSPGPAKAGPRSPKSLAPPRRETLPPKAGAPAARRTTPKPKASAKAARSKTARPKSRPAKRAKKAAGKRKAARSARVSARQPKKSRAAAARKATRPKAKSRKAKLKGRRKA